MPRPAPRNFDRDARKKHIGTAHLVIRHSKIDSEGCYATAPIKKDAVIVEYTGPRITIKEADALYDDHPRTYLFGLSDGKHVIDGEGVAAFINHSCNPNCEADEKQGRVWIIAIRDIEAGEELTYDYNLYDGDLDDPSPCSCGAPNCRGSMYSEKELARRTQALRRRKKKQGETTRPEKPAAKGR
jgi:SET domain-containing protein